MEETQAIDFDDLPADEEPVQANIHQVSARICSACRKLLAMYVREAEWFDNYR